MRRASARNFKVPKDIIERNMVSCFNWNLCPRPKSNLEWTLK